MGVFDKFKRKINSNNFDIELPTEVNLVGPIDGTTINTVYIPQTQRTLEVKIPNHIEPEQRIILRGCGLKKSSGQAGDLILIITHVNCLDITINKNIPLSRINEKISVRVPHQNCTVDVTIPAQLKQENSFTLKLHGLGLSDKSGKFGDLFLKVHIITNDSTNSNYTPDDSAFSELNSLIGLANIKRDVSNMANLVKMQMHRSQQGLKTVPISMHCVFSGNPGTGKTTVARILADIYRKMGVLSKGHLVEVDRAGLVSQYIGETAIKTQEVINKALGGILFIDEAYTLVKEGRDHGQEAIDTLLKAMEDHREDFVVIVAGYDNLMNSFINSNPGLKSRFSKYFHFPDYSADEMEQIFLLLCNEYGYWLTSRAESILRMKIKHIDSNKGENFANAREVRNLFEKVITNQAARLSNVKSADLTQITEEDFFDI